MLQGVNGRRWQQIMWPYLPTRGTIDRTLTDRWEPPSAKSRACCSVAVRRARRIVDTALARPEECGHVTTTARRDGRLGNGGYASSNGGLPVIRSRKELGLGILVAERSDQL